MKIVTTCALFIFFCIGITCAQEKLPKLDSLFTKLYTEGKFNGNVLIAEKGIVVFEKSYGLANEHDSTKLNKQSIFNLASVTKQFTAMSIVLLKKQGKLSYSDSLATFIPELAFYNGVTINNLLTHTGGLPDYMTMMDARWEKSKIANNADVIKMMVAIKPKALFAPGDEYKYSNTGYVLLAAIIERISKQTYGEFLKQHIFKPAKMNKTFVYSGDSPKQKNMVEGYVKDSLGENVLPKDVTKFDYVKYLDGVYGQGRVYSTTGDLLKWDRFLYNSQLINNEDKETIFTSQKTNAKLDTDYGYGWMIDDNKLYGRIIYHSGSWPGFVSYLEREIDSDKTIVILQNNSRAVIPTRQIRKILYNLPLDNRIAVDTSILKNYAGIYHTTSGSKKIISVDKGKLYLFYSAQNTMELIPVAKDRFLVEGFSPDVIYQFYKDASGKVIKYQVQQKETGTGSWATKMEL